MQPGFKAGILGPLRMVGEALLAERDFPEDVTCAVDMNVSDTVPLLQHGEYEAL